MYIWFDENAKYNSDNSQKTANVVKRQNTESAQCEVLTTQKWHKPGRLVTDVNPYTVAVIRHQPNAMPGHQANISRPLRQK